MIRYIERWRQIVKANKNREQHRAWQRRSRLVIRELYPPI